ncbi:MAG: type II toxin-antitoxin system VapC family toxin [Gemmataceae bacterium]|nr:type II toxin-antitoxin system VapC family toxin [Planctomycetia bacterium]MBX3398876.1 type II toxin-antitoxin system VapC family toxin [Gemmataceae bacterium]
MKFLLDTDHVSILERPASPQAAAILSKIVALDLGDVGVSVVSYQEQSKGCNNLINRATHSAELVAAYDLHFRVIDFFRSFPLVSFDIRAAGENERLRKLKLGIGTMDLRIAAVALARDLVVVTRNVADFSRVPDLRHCDWTI